MFHGAQGIIRETPVRLAGSGFTEQLPRSVLLVPFILFAHLHPPRSSETPPHTESFAKTFPVFQQGFRLKRPAYRPKA
jgi:hypothetical protein